MIYFTEDHQININYDYLMRTFTIDLLDEDSNIIASYGIKPNDIPNIEDLPDEFLYGDFRIPDDILEDLRDSKWSAS